MAKMQYELFSPWQDQQRLDDAGRQEEQLCYKNTATAI